MRLLHDISGTIICITSFGKSIPNYEEQRNETEWYFYRERLFPSYNI